MWQQLVAEAVHGKAGCCSSLLRLSHSWCSSSRTVRTSPGGDRGGGIPLVAAFMAGLVVLVAGVQWLAVVLMVGVQWLLYQHCSFLDQDHDL